MSASSLLQRLGINRVRIEPLTVDGQTVNVSLRKLGADELVALMNEFRDASGTIVPEREVDVRNRLVAASVIDEAGAPELSPSEVGELPRDFLLPLVDAVLRTQGLASNEADAKKD